MNTNKRIIIILTIFTVIFTVLGSTLAYWNWQTNEYERTEVVFTVEQDFWCAVDGGGDITSEDATIAPSSCTNSTHAIQRTVTVKPTIERNNLTIFMDLYIDIDAIDSGLSNSQNFKYALTTNANSCTTGVVASGNFNGKSAGDQVQILNGEAYSSSTTQTYYLYIWLDAEETSTDTMNQTFSMSMSGDCTDDGKVKPSSPTLDDGMIPVKISENGNVTTISSGDENWYNYDNQEWANVVLVNDDSRSTYLNTTGVTVSSDDILAYYTWIPRYSYKMATCASLENPTIEDNPECYAPYTMSDTDKNKLIEFWEDYTYCEGIDYYLEEATSNVEYALQNGRFVSYGGHTLTEFIEMYNSGENFCNLSSDGTTISATAGDFNSTISLAGPNSIDIQFETASTAISNGDATTSYKTHPAFWWDDDSDGAVDTGETVAGIWVGKFETSADSSSTCYTSASTTNCNNTTQSPRVLPNVYSLRYQYIGNQFTTSQKFTSSENEYGLSNTSTNAHMMKNSEWGAVAYLSHSTYGINEEIRINNNSKYTTGCGASTANGGSNSTCQIAYGAATSYPQSTTGNITGVFDMSGGSWEYVMGNYGNTANSTYIPTLPATKYYDVYSVNQFTGYYGGNMAFCTLDTCGGHALYETAGWYSDYAFFVDSDGPWFSRGGDYGGAVAGAFYSSGNYGYAISNDSWRSVLVVGFGA